MKLTTKWKQLRALNERKGFERTIFQMPDKKWYHRSSVCTIAYGPYESWRQAKEALVRYYETGGPGCVRAVEEACMAEIDVRNLIADHFVLR